MLRLERRVRALDEERDRRLVLAVLGELLTRPAPAELETAVTEVRLDRLSPYLRNCVAAMVELASQRKGVMPPSWTRGGSCPWTSRSSPRTFPG